MNEERRKILDHAQGYLSVGVGDIETVIEAEQEAFDNMPESLQDGDKGQRLVENISALESIVSEIEELISEIDSVCEK